MRLSLLVDFLAYDNEQPTNDPADAIALKKRVEEASVSEVSRLFPQVIPDSTTDLAITLPDATTNYLILLTDQTISVKLNGSSDAVTLKPKAAGKKTPVLLIRGDVTGLSVSNASGNPAKLDMIAVKI